MASREFRVGEYTYQVRPMSALLQGDVLAALLPLATSGVFELVPILQDAAKNGGFAGMEASFAEAAKGAVAVSKAFAGMEPKDRRFVVSSCLSHCARKATSGDGWAPVWIEEAGVASGDDINFDVLVMYEIVFNVLKVLFLPFFSGLVSRFQGAA